MKKARPSTGTLEPTRGRFGGGPEGVAVEQVTQVEPLGRLIGGATDRWVHKRTVWGDRYNFFFMTHMGGTGDSGISVD